MTTSLIFPWRTDHADRERIRSYLWPAWDALDGFELIDGLCPPGPWCKGAAWADGLRKASGEFVCLMDWDCWVPKLSEAVGLLSQGHRWVQGQDMVFRFDAAMTARLLRGDLSIADAAKLENVWEDRPRMASAGVGTILRREDADEIPLDPRFRGWGFEDNAWWEALTTMYGYPGRLSSSVCFHLHHKPQADKDRTPTAQSPNWRMYREYVRARGRPQRMEEVIERARAALRA